MKALLALRKTKMTEKFDKICESILEETRSSDNTLIVKDPNTYRDIEQGYLEVIEIKNDIVEFHYLNNFKERLSAKAEKIPLVKFNKKFKQKLTGMASTNVPAKRNPTFFAKAVCIHTNSGVL